MTDSLMTTNISNKTTESTTAGDMSDPASTPTPMVTDTNGVAAAIAASASATNSAGAPPAASAPASTTTNASNPPVELGDSGAGVGITGTDDMISRETFEMVKKQLAVEQQRVAALRAHKDSADQAARQFISDTHSDGVAYLETLGNDLPPMQKAMIGEFKQRLTDMPNTPAEQLDADMPLAVLVHCASSNAKKRAMDDDAAKERADELRKVLQENEELKAENAKKSKIITDVSALAEERHAQTEEACRKLAALTGAARKYDFSLPSSRHSGLSSATSAAAASLAAAHLDAQPQAPAKTLTPSEQMGIPSSIAAGKQPVNSTIDQAATNANPEGITSTIHAASMGGAGGVIAPGAGVLPTAAGFASWTMRMGAGGARVHRSAGPHEILGGSGQGPTSDGAGSSSGVSGGGSSFDIETAIRQASGAM